jgi:hypothetical protein
MEDIYIQDAVIQLKHGYKQDVILRERHIYTHTTSQAYRSHLILNKRKRQLCLVIGSDIIKSIIAYSIINTEWVATNKDLIDFKTYYLETGNPKSTEDYIDSASDFLFLYAARSESLYSSKFKIAKCLELELSRRAVDTNSYNPSWFIEVLNTLLFA